MDLRWSRNEGRNEAPAGSAPPIPNADFTKPTATAKPPSIRICVSLGLWHGVYEGRTYDWIRLFRPDGSLVPTEALLRALLQKRGQI